MDIILELDADSLVTPCANGLVKEDYKDVFFNQGASSKEHAIHAYTYIDNCGILDDKDVNAGIYLRGRS